MSHKQAILIRQDLKLPKGKAVSQGSHAAVEAVWRSKKADIEAWRSEGMAKIVLKVDDEKALFVYVQLAKDAGLATAVITDAGRTVVEPGTITAAAIGPAPEEKIDAIVGKLKLF